MTCSQCTRLIYGLNVALVHFFSAQFTWFRFTADKLVCGRVDRIRNSEEVRSQVLCGVGAFISLGS